MYQPYIRGKQFELLGLQELIVPVLSSDTTKISPIIEPVKDSSTLKKTINALAKNNINFTLIINPQVGSFNDPEAILEVLLQSVGGYKNYQVGVIFHPEINHEKIVEVLRKYRKAIPALSIIHNTTFDNISDILAHLELFAPIKYNVINLSLTSRRYFRNFERKTLIEFDDYFNAQSKNADYLLTDDSTFSEEHLYYQEDGYAGFADYLTIGKDYSESGFLPYAVAIHLSYVDERNKKIRVKHFVSDSNNDPSDIAGKFAEALTKLIRWCDNTGHNTIAVHHFRQFDKNGHFPGLGTLKKLSLMNHIHLVSNLMK